METHGFWSSPISGKWYITGSDETGSLDYYIDGDSFGETWYGHDFADGGSVTANHRYSRSENVSGPDGQFEDVPSISLVATFYGEQ